MTREEIQHKLIEVLETVIAIDNKHLKDISASTDFITDLGAPSMELVNIVAKVEEKFDVEFDDDDVDDLGSTVGDTINLIIKALQEG